MVDHEYYLERPPLKNLCTEVYIIPGQLKADASATSLERQPKE